MTYFVTKKGEAYNLDHVARLEIVELEQEDELTDPSHALQADLPHLDEYVYLITGTEDQCKAILSLILSKLSVVKET